jgi:hypothetical protein
MQALAEAAGAGAFIGMLIVFCRCGQWRRGRASVRDWRRQDEHCGTSAADSGNLARVPDSHRDDIWQGKGSKTIEHQRPVAPAPARSLKRVSRHR